MAINDVFQATIGMNIEGQKIVNVLHFEQTSGDGALPTNRDLCLAISEDLLGVYQSVLSEDVSIETVRAHKIYPSIGGTHIEPIDNPGIVSEDTLPCQIAVVATLYSNTFTRQGRGRIYMGGVPDTFVEHGRLTVPGADEYDPFLDALVLPIQAGTGATFRGGVWSSVGNAFHDFTSHELRAAVVTLRSRRMNNP